MSSEPSSSMGSVVPSTHHARPVPISAVVYSLNEAKLLGPCLALLQDFDEVVVCDMGSEDATVQVADSFAARVVQVPRAPVVEQVRQLGLDAAQNDWVLFVDADEHVPTGFYGTLQKALVTELAAGSQVSAVRLRYTNVAFGVVLEHNLQGSAKYALMRSSASTYPRLGRAHIPPEFTGDVLDAPASVPPILHHNFRSVAQSMEKTLRYAQSNPHGRDDIADPVGLVRDLLRSVVFTGAWRDGRAGVVLATINWVGRFYASALDWEAAGYTPTGLERTTTRRLSAVATAQHRVVDARDAVRRIAGRRRS